MIGVGRRALGVWTLGVCSLLSPGDKRGASAAGVRLVNADMLNNGCTLSLDPDRFLPPGGGGGNTGFEMGSGEALYTWLFAGDRVDGDKAEAGSSANIMDARLLRGGEYGGGAGTTTIAYVSPRNSSRPQNAQPRHFQKPVKIPYHLDLALASVPQEAGRRRCLVNPIVAGCIGEHC